MVGKIWTNEETPIVDTSSGSVIGELIDNVSDFYIVHNPCEIQFNIETPAQGSASLNWTLKPYYYKHLIADGGVSHAAFAFKKDDVAISNIGGTTIHPDILAAYKELVG